MSFVRYVAARVKNGGLFAYARTRGGYSHFGQDLWVAERLRGKRGGFFVDLGAYTPVVANNTYLLESRYGWKGICIEANPRLFAKLKAKRRCVCVEACVSGDGKPAEFLADGGAYGGMVEQYPAGHDATLLKYLPHCNVTEGGKLKTRRVETVLLADILQAHGAPPVIDYLSMDVEGAELSILRTFPFDRYRMLTMTVEHNSRPEYRKDISDVL
ncbi:MAG TPA: FkbM family methyltransferase, partial [Candidatus Peribacteria bacterium]|nr:FkbM family methyltransferase [Candidatus Peribacteria bacterium]